jgi:hypothetical protein
MCTRLKAVFRGHILSDGEHPSRPFEHVQAIMTWRFHESVIGCRIERPMPRDPNRQVIFDVDVLSPVNRHWICVD